MIAFAESDEVVEAVARAWLAEGFWPLDLRRSDEGTREISGDGGA